MWPDHPLTTKENTMDKLVYLLLGPIGCVAGMAVCMAPMGRGRRRSDDNDRRFTGDVTGSRG